MSVFFEYPTDVSEAGKGTLLCTAFSHDTHPILAVSTSNGDLTLFHEEGESIAIEIHLNNENSSFDPSQTPLPSSFHRNSACHHMEWSSVISNGGSQDHLNHSSSSIPQTHPHHTAPILACGWKDGCISLWSEKEHVLRETVRAHQSPITMIRWSPDYTRLLSGEENGVLCVWSVDARLRLILLCKYDHSISRAGAINYVTFRSYRAQYTTSTCPPFFFSTSNGHVVFADDCNHSSVLLRGTAPLNFLHYSVKGDYLSMVTQDANLLQYRVGAQGELELLRTVKISVKGSGSDLKIELCGEGLIGAANNESLIRFFSLEKDESYLLAFDNKHLAQAKDVITCIAFNPRKRVLSGGTASGRIVFWRFVGSHTGEMSETDWEGLPAMESSCPIKNIAWGPGEGLLSLYNDENVSIVLETVMQFKYVDGINVVQMTADSVYISTSDSDKSLKFTAGVRIKGLDVSKQYVLVWNGKLAEVRSLAQLAAGMSDPSSSFACRATQCCLHGDEIYCSTGGRIEVCNLQGTVLRILPMAEHEGAPKALHINQHYLSVATDKARLAVYDLSVNGVARIVVPHFDIFSPIRVGPQVTRLIVTSVCINRQGTRVSLLCKVVDNAGLERCDTRIHVYDVETDRMEHFEFGPVRYPVRHSFDETDARILAVECKAVEVLIKDPMTTTSDFSTTDVDTGVTAVNHETAEVTVLFCTGLLDEGRALLMQDSFSIDPTKDTLVALSVPHFILLSRPQGDSTDGEWPSKIKQRTMRDFIGLENVSEDIRRELLAFSFAATVGNMDEAYRCVKKIGGGGEAIWENLAQQCVKTKRLDVAEMCLGQLNNARGVRAVREAKRERPVEMAIAEVAIQLHMLEDAERLYREVGRWNKLVQFYSASGRWKDAIAIASRHDRIHLRSLHHSYARHLEQLGDVREAIIQYELARTASTEVPRMMSDCNRIEELRAYIDARPNDRDLSKWWAQHAESSGDLEAACHYYRRANEHLALVRIYCFRNDIQAALDLCQSSRDEATCFHLARHFEGEGNIQKAIELYTLAGCDNHAIRLSIEAQLDGPLLTAALQAQDTQSKVQAAEYFEAQGALEKAAMLYERAGRFHRALDLCFQGSLFDALRSITDRLEQTTDLALLSKCATFFIDNQQYEKGASLLMKAGRLRQALQLFEEHNITITEQIAELMTPARPGPNSMLEEKKERETILTGLAVLCRAQGSFHLACKKFTQAGDSVQATQCLIKSGDTEKLLYYANMAKKPEVWILSANHLSTLDWHGDSNIYNAIVTYHTKAKAWTQLCSFFETCATVEIDEFREYDKALVALKEAIKAAIKANIGGKETKVRDLQNRITSVESLLSARALVDSDPAAMRQACLELIEQPEVPLGARKGDIFAMLIELEMRQNRTRDAMAHVDAMQSRQLTISTFIDPELLQQIYAANGRKPERSITEEEKTHDSTVDINEELGN